MIFMHSIIEEILESTQKRAKSLRNNKTLVADQRNFKDILKTKKQKNLIPVIVKSNLHLRPGSSGMLIPQMPLK